mmetsp:Transcript_23624/g.74235  ORF Transcript_23624/g.74235 Transcript_23624/m.74235 type:complete len:238 (-) Transcript_23624:63-776(-)
MATSSGDAKGGEGSATPPPAVDPEEVQGVLAELPEPGSVHRGVVLEAAFPLAHGTLVLSRGSVVDFDGDAIVNAANERCLGGGGVDGAISRAGGDALAEAREALPADKKGRKGARCRCPTGDAVVTTGGDLAASWCVHAVGPNYSYTSNEEGDELLASAYARSLEVAAENGAIETIAFSLISAGVYRGDNSKEHVLSIAVDAVRGATYPNLREVHLVAFSDAEMDSLKRVASLSFSR